MTSLHFGVESIGKRKQVMTWHGSRQRFRSGGVLQCEMEKLNSIPLFQPKESDIFNVGNMPSSLVAEC